MIVTILKKKKDSMKDRQSQFSRVKNLHFSYEGSMVPQYITVRKSITVHICFVCVLKDLLEFGVGIHLTYTICLSYRCLLDNVILRQEINYLILNVRKNSELLIHFYLIYNYSFNVRQVHVFKIFKSLMIFHPQILFYYFLFSSTVECLRITSTNIRIVYSQTTKTFLIYY